jgi:uncharacterized protein
MALIIEIKVIPSAGSAKITLDKSGMIKCYVVSAPEDGKANREVILLWSQALDISRSLIDIVSGLASRKKKIKIHASLTLEQVMHKLGLDMQSGLL